MEQDTYYTVIKTGEGKPSYYPFHSEHEGRRYMVQCANNDGHFGSEIVDDSGDEILMKNKDGEEYRYTMVSGRPAELIFEMTHTDRERYVTILVTEWILSEENPLYCDAAYFAENKDDDLLRKFLSLAIRNSKPGSKARAVRNELAHNDFDRIEWSYVARVLAMRSTSGIGLNCA
ncbi:hypothetical protein [Nocardia sp. IFM 10818]